MQVATPFGRLVTAIVTPFDEQGAVDFPKFAELVDYQLERGVDALCVCGTTGESPCLSVADKLALFAEAVRVSAGRAPVIANVGSNCTADSVALAREAAAVGADAVMCVVPYYNKPTQEGMYQHFRAVAGAVPGTTVVIYNIPGRSVVNMEAATAVRIATDCPNVRAMKEAATDVEQLRAVLAGTPAGFAVYSGNDERTLEYMGEGASGVISTTSNVAPAEMAELVDSFAAGNVAKATSMHERLLPLMTGLFKAPNPTLVKEAMRLVGRPVGGLRLPMVPPTPEQSAMIAGCLAQAGIR